MLMSDDISIFRGIMQLYVWSFVIRICWHVIMEIVYSRKMDIQSNGDLP